ncbi:hypothetical protein OXX59_010046, partial [Metschnikowia pulcherrima]
MTVEGVSAISLATSDENAFKNTSSFYRSLGFKLIKTYNAVVSAGSNNYLQGFASDSIKELWLEAFPLQTRDNAGNVVPWQDLQFYNGDATSALCSSTLLKLR